MGEPDFHRRFSSPQNCFFRSAYSVHLRIKTAVDLPGS
jgi:hypothetical protein